MLVKTVKDVLDEFGGNGVFVHRHAKYLPDPEGYLLSDVLETFIRNYTREIPDNHYPLSQQGRDDSEEQGKLIVELGIPIKRIIVSKNGRGPETGLYVGMGMVDESGTMPPILHHPGADYPVYNRDKLRERLQMGDVCVVKWLNGEHPDQCTESPEAFCERVIKMVEEYIQDDGCTFIATHFEAVTLAQGMFVDKVELGSIAEEKFPEKSTGVLVVKDGNGLIGFSYDQVLSIVE